MAGALANATAVVHFVSLLYIGLGGFLGCKWPKSLFVHAFFAAWGLSIILTDLFPCPLTALQDHLRHLQGLGSMPGGFNEYYIYGVVFPHSWLPVVATSAITVIVISYIGAVALRWKRTATAGADTARRRSWPVSPHHPSGGAARPTKFQA